MSEDLVMFFLVRDGALERFKALVKREFGEYEAHMEEFLYKRLPQVNPPTAAPPAAAASGAGAGAGASAGNTQVAGKKVVRSACPSRASASSATTTTTTPAIRTKPQGKKHVTTSTNTTNPAITFYLTDTIHPISSTLNNDNDINSSSTSIIRRREHNKKSGSPQEKESRSIRVWF